MKIKEVNTYFVRPRWGFVEIITDEGLSGWGEAVLEGHAGTVLACVHEMEDYLIGADPANIEDIWTVLYRAGFYRGGGVLMSAISGIDQALWDIKGKYFNAPVHQLMGGSCRNKMRVYSWIGGDRPSDVGAAAREKMEAGFTAVKMNATEELQFIDSYDKIDAVLERVDAIRASCGKDFGIAVDFHGRVHKPMAKILAKKLEVYDPMFIEEPVLCENMESFREIAAACQIPIATGERIHNIFEFQMLLERKACHYVRASICLCGGITGAMKIAALAESHHCSLVPHNPLSPVATNAELNLCTAIDNLAIAEYPSPYVRSTQDLFMNSNNKNLCMKDMVNHIPDVKDGYIEIPTGPGIGIELIPDVEDKFPFQPHKINTRLYEDGSICDQ